MFVNNDRPALSLFQRGVIIMVLTMVTVREERGWSAAEACLEMSPGRAETSFSRCCLDSAPVQGIRSELHVRSTGFHLDHGTGDLLLCLCAIGKKKKGVPKMHSMRLGRSAWSQNRVRWQMSFGVRIVRMSHWSQSSFQYPIIHRSYVLGWLPSSLLLLSLRKKKKKVL